MLGVSRKRPNWLIKLIYEERRKGPVIFVQMYIDDNDMRMDEMSCIYILYRVSIDNNEDVCLFQRF